MKKIYIVIVLFGTLFSSCKDDLLDKAPLDRFTDAVVWKDPALIDAFLLSQYAYTPVMINDATTVFTSWEGSPSNRDPRSGNLRYWFGNSAQTFGPGLSIEISDEAKYTSGAWTNVLAEKIFGISAEGGVMEWWENSYYTIRNLNEFIERVPSSPLSERNKAIRVAEARFLRAFCYFAMVKRYGGVPLLTTVPQLDSPEDLLYPKRNTEQELWDFILSETKEISEILPSVQDEYGRANKWAALSLHARAALFAGSIAKYGTLNANKLTGLPSNLSQSYFQKAYDASKSIIEDSPYRLYTEDVRGNDLEGRVQNFKNIFLKKRNSEIIMAKQHGGKSFDPGGGTSTWSWDICHAPRPSVWGQGNYQAPYLELIEAFDYIDGTSGTLDRNYVQSRLWTMGELWKNRDPRFYASIWTNGTPWRDAVASNFGKDTINFHHGLITENGTLLTNFTASYKGMPAVGDQSYFHASTGISNTGFGIMKYLDPSADNMVWLMESRTDYAIFRLGETYLNFAEAAYELSKVNDALTAVNEIRSRAGVQQLSSITMDKIRKERQVELAFENHRYWDLRRWRQAETKLSRSFSGIQYVLDYSTKKYKVLIHDKIDGEVDPMFPARNYYFPITVTRRGQNKNLEENPGYN
ncbi:RagB/SusD domain protein [Pseudopedobacter saltans DSM 12145]|uniref:RagB/SusD domain protein n=1 Tax=Pseudopedobacter saltans (strain ATCC 51119 / DSM 12145 / JCM 21818 / CCUG 39354 / LMG 10337 / NBRC 100064 / NCIMB 13643) TaxID=762903 RepID=F0SAM0_PSESL|nr:RagB/SusD family nutrient uptake outer membrane protein [Pseudopedobacter saltans]ADY53641.1 RagB/SusD domain protein [Pseudopedobacter saltans DSM 12145]